LVFVKNFKVAMMWSFMSLMLCFWWIGGIPMVLTRGSTSHS
jgi:hypothetical protein